MKVPPKKPHFFKPIKPGFKHGLKIPIGFLKYLKGQERQYAVLRRAGKKWPVKLNGHQLEEGWEKFAEEHDLQSGNMLVFRHEGDMEFEVDIFDSSQCNEYHQKGGEGREEGEREEEVEQEAHMVEKPKNFEYKEAATHNPFGQSHFVWTVRPYCLSKSYLAIPTRFARANGLTNKNCGLIIRDQRQRSWNLRLSGYGSRVYMIGGWAKFSAANGFKVGDCIMFEVVTNGETPVWNFHEYLEYLQEEAKAVEGTSKKVVKDKRKPRIASSSKAFRRAVASTPCLGQSHVEFTVKPYCLSNGYFRLPKKFAMANGLTSKKCGLIIRDGRQRSWDFRLYTSYSNVYVGGRWGKFCIANELQVGDHIRCEVVTNGEKPIWKFHDLRGSPSLQPDIKNILEDKRISDKGLHFQEQTDLKIKTSGVTARKSQVPASTSSDGANPYFISTIKPYIITNTVLYLPMAFAKSNGLINRSKMILVDDKRRSWPVRLGKTGTHFVIKRDGWTQFMIANGVQVGDSYKFDLINNGSDGTTPIAHFYCNYSGKDDKQHRSH